MIAGLALSGVPAVTASAVPAPSSTTTRPGGATRLSRPHWVIIGQGGADGAHLVVEHLELRFYQVGKPLLVDNCIPDCALGETDYHKLYVTLSG